MKRLGLIGHPLSHSFSERYFSEKFFREGIPDWSYQLFDLPHLPQDLISWWSQQSGLVGINVTIPYKERILEFVNSEHQSEHVRTIGAANTLVMDPVNLALRAENTDWCGFLEALDQEHVFSSGRPALVLGNGGASKAIQYALGQINVDFAIAHRAAGPKTILYEDLNGQMEQFGLIVNTTPLGTFPKEDAYPPLPYEEIDGQHYYFDLVYRPEKTAAMKMCDLRGAYVQNGYGMLVSQAEFAWSFWGEFYR